MTDREKLVELIMLCFDIDEDGYCCLNERQKDDIVQEIVDQLISHGVTVQKHGRWVEKPNPWGQDGSHSYDCSVCGKRTCVVGEKLHFCPNCGAKMDGET